MVLEVNIYICIKILNFKQKCNASKSVEVDINVSFRTFTLKCKTHKN